MECGEDSVRLTNGMHAEGDQCLTMGPDVWTPLSQTNKGKSCSVRNDKFRIIHIWE